MARKKNTTNLTELLLLQNLKDRGLSPALISARNPLRQLCSLLPNFIFSGALFANIT